MGLYALQDVVAQFDVRVLSKTPHTYMRLLCSLQYSCIVVNYGLEWCCLGPPQGDDLGSQLGLQVRGIRHTHPFLIAMCVFNLNGPSPWELSFVWEERCRQGRRTWK